MNIKRVLMCPPEYYTVEYIINPWMKPGSVDKVLAKKQWTALVKTYQKLGIKVDFIPPQPYLPDMVFAADQSVAYNGNVIMSNFKYQERQSERQHYLNWFENNNFSVDIIPEGYYLEGQGECLNMGDTLYVGTGFRSTKEGAIKLGEAFGIRTIPLELINPDFYHLDTCFFPLNEYTAFYYPAAFSDESRKKLITNIPHVIPFTKKEVYGFASNNVVFGKYVLTQAGNKTFISKIKQLKYLPIEINVSEFIKAGGGIHCLTNILL